MRLLGVSIVKNKMSAKTLKYNRVHNCPANQFKEHKQPEQPEQAIKKAVSELDEKNIKLVSIKALPKKIKVSS